SSHNITTSIVVLVIFTVVAWLVLALEWLPSRRRSTPAVPVDGSQPGVGPRRVALRIVLVALIVAGVEQSLFASNFLSSAHNPVSTNMPFGVVGTSSLIDAVPKNSIQVTNYTSQSDAQNAIDKGNAWGALIPGSGKTNTLLVVPSISDLAPLTLAQNFESAAK